MAANDQEVVANECPFGPADGLATGIARLAYSGWIDETDTETPIAVIASARN
jgi:hypothetical protein